MKKLPDLFTNTFDKKIDNNEEYITIKNNNTDTKKYTKYEILKKIDNIFKSTDYILAEKALKAAADRCIAVVEESEGNGSFLRELDNN